MSVFFTFRHFPTFGCRSIPSFFHNSVLVKKAEMSIVQPLDSVLARPMLSVFCHYIIGVKHESEDDP